MVTPVLLPRSEMRSSWVGWWAVKGVSYGGVWNMDGYSL